MFLILMVAGLVGLAMMALPAIGRHGHAGQLARGGHPTLHAGHIAKLGPMSTAGAALKGVAGKSGIHVGQALVKQGNALAGAETADTESRLARFIPSPRLICSLLALYGAFGNALLHAAHFSTLAAGLVAAVPAILVEKFAVTPLWRLLFRFQGQPSSPLDELVLSDAKAVTPFRNGRGLVSLVRDGRLVQFAATLVESQAGLPVRVGDRLRVEEVDGPRERLTVSVPED